MSQTGTRIPAWRRLGLALKNETQSGVAAPEPSAPQSDHHHNTPYDAQNGSRDHQHSPIEPAVNGEPAKLGKRKHEHEPAEEDQISKRSKTSPTDTLHNENIVAETPVLAATDSSSAPTPSTALPASEISQSKGGEPKGGDPNYRKKKAKPRNKRRSNDDPTPVQTEAKPDRVSLSPGAAPPKKARRTLLASTETDHQGIEPASTPQRLRETSRGSTYDSSGSPSAIDRRKSVTFTPDTKRVDGHSAQSLFKTWVAEQRGADDGSAVAEVVQPASSASEETVKEEKTSKKRQKEQQSKAVEINSTIELPQKESVPATPAPKGKKKDPALYNAYVTQYHTDRDNWKFNKAKQNDVIDNAASIFRIPDENSEALLAYVQSLKGAGAISLLTSKCEAALKELDQEDIKAQAMDDPKERQAMHDEALQTRIAQEQKRRKVEGDMEALSQHPHGDNFIRRLRRKRAEALLTALGRTTPILPATQTNGINPLLQNLAPKRDSKKRKRRGDISSDESSSDSSSDEDSSSSEEESDDSDDSDPDSKSKAESDGASDSDEESESGSEKSQSSDGDSDSDSD
jgi:hypothetical protein